MRTAAASRKLAFKFFAATASLSVTAAFLAAGAPAVYAAQVGGIQGTVKDSAGAPLQGAQVVLTPVGGGAGQVDRTDSSGNYSFAGLQPGNYTIQVNVVTYTSDTQNVAVVQDINGTVDFALTKKTVNQVGTGITISRTKRTESAQIQQVTAKDEQNEKSQPNNLYQSTGLLNFKLGVTTDAGQYPHVRGSDGNQINWSIDGIDLRDPITNQFATNLVTAGISTSNVITGGADASYGGSAGAYLNQITADGRTISKGKTFGGFIENTNGPASKWKYSGGNVQIGGLLPGGKLDYAFSSIVFKTKYGDNTQLGDLQSSHDEVGKINFYASPNDTITTLFAHGAENYNSFQTSSNSNFFDPDQVLTDPTTGTQYTSTRDLGTNFTDHNVQTYNLDHITYKHNFASSSFIQGRIYQLHQAIPNHQEATGNFFNTDRSNVTGEQLNYYNQLNKSNTLLTGLDFKSAKGSYRRQIVGVSAGPLKAPVGSVAGTRYSDRTYNAYPEDFALYLADQLKLSQDKVTLNLGVRFQSTTYKGGSSKYLDSIGVSEPSQFTTKSTDPRFGLNYSPSPDLTFRTSYSINSQHADQRRIQRLGPEDVGNIGTSLNAAPLRQSRDAQIGQGFSRVNLSHSKDYDLGVEKAFSIGGVAKGLYSVSLTGYNKYGYDIAFLQQDDYGKGRNNIGATIGGVKIGNGGFHNTLYDNSGTQHAAGIEFGLRKVQRKPSDWNGYINYTNQVVRTNSSLYDTAYVPYFVALQGNNFDNATLHALAHREFAPSWDQRHTIGVVANKRFSKLFESSFILDAGSGLPFFPSATSNGNIGSAGNDFADIGATTTGTAEFTQVPITVGGGRLPSLNPVTGHTGWHYKISINSSFYITPDFSLFLNVDNIFNKKTALSLATGTFSGEPYYVGPSAEFPQGQEVFRYQSKLTPTYLTFGFRQRF